MVLINGDREVAVGKAIEIERRLNVIEYIWLGTVSTHHHSDIINSRQLPITPSIMSSISQKTVVKSSGSTAKPAEPVEYEFDFTDPRNPSHAATLGQPTEATESAAQTVEDEIKRRCEEGKLFPASLAASVPQTHIVLQSNWDATVKFWPA